MILITGFLRGVSAKIKAMWEIYSFFSWQWVAFFLWFLVAIGFSWFLPGLVVLSYTKLAKSTQFLIAPVLGMVLWAIQGYALGWLQLRWGMFVLILFHAVWAAKRAHQIFPLTWKFSLILSTTVSFNTAMIGSKGVMSR